MPFHEIGCWVGCWRLNVLLLGSTSYSVDVGPNMQKHIVFNIFDLRIAPSWGATKGGRASVFNMPQVLAYLGQHPNLWAVGWSGRILSPKHPKHPTEHPTSCNCLDSTPCIFFSCNVCMCMCILKYSMTWTMEYSMTSGNPTIGLINPPSWSNTPNRKEHVFFFFYRTEHTQTRTYLIRILWDFQKGGLANEGGQPTFVEAAEGRLHYAWSNVYQICVCL